MPDPVDGYAAEDERIWLEQLRATLEKKLDELPQDERDILRRRFYQGQSLTDIAGETGQRTADIRRLELWGLTKLRRHPEELRRFLYPDGDIRAAGLRHVGVSQYATTGTSATEWAAMRMVEGKPL